MPCFEPPLLQSLIELKERIDAAVQTIDRTMLQNRKVVNRKIFKEPLFPKRISRNYANRPITRAIRKLGLLPLTQIFVSPAELHKWITRAVSNVYSTMLTCRVKFEQISVFERGRIVGLREAGLSYRAVAARVQRNSSTIMRVSKQWTDEGRTARKSVSGPRNVTSAREDRRLVRMAETDRTAFLDNWQHSGQQLHVFHRVLHQFGDVCCSVGCAQGFLYTGFLSRKTIAACDYTGPMCIGAGVLIGSRSSFLTNPASICGTMMAEFESGSMPVNGAFRSVLSNATVDEHPELWSGVP
ncbi:transposable element Tc1 transposase [Trichonephila clavipes]|nr:transposable element Tc1 transposase [Trichonephila clavipes]